MACPLSGWPWATTQVSCAFHWPLLPGQSGCLEASGFPCGAFPGLCNFFVRKKMKSCHTRHLQAHPHAHSLSLQTATFQFFILLPPPPPELKTTGQGGSKSGTVLDTVKAVFVGFACPTSLPPYSLKEHSPPRFWQGNNHSIQPNHWSRHDLGHLKDRNPLMPKWELRIQPEPTRVLSWGFMEKS